MAGTLFPPECVRYGMLSGVSIVKRGIKCAVAPWSPLGCWSNNVIRLLSGWIFNSGENETWAERKTLVPNNTSLSSCLALTIQKQKRRKLLSVDIVLCTVLQVRLVLFYICGCFQIKFIISLASHFPFSAIQSSNCIIHGLKTCQWFCYDNSKTLDVMQSRASKGDTCSMQCKLDLQMQPCLIEDRKLCCGFVNSFISHF